MFSGQGAQYSGMGLDLYESSPAAREVFDMADRVRPGTSSQCFSGGDEELARTENTQPCIYCLGLAAAAALSEAGCLCHALAGFSLGELSALAFSGAVSYEDGFRMVCKRAKLMQHASDKFPAGMLAVLKLPDDEVTSLCREFEGFYPVNFNCNGQVVVAGPKGALADFADSVKGTGGKAMLLKVSGGFHSPYMAEAGASFADALSSFHFGQPGVPLYSNVTGQPYGDDIRGLLAKQVSSPVLWRGLVENLLLWGADYFVELGPGRALCGLVSRIHEGARVFNVQDSASLKKSVQGLLWQSEYP